MTSAVVPEWLDYTSLGISGLSLLVAFVFGLRNRSIAKRALQLSQEQEARRHVELAAYVQQAVSWREPSRRRRVLGVNLLVTNASDRPTAVVNASMRVTCTLDGMETSVMVPHNEAVQKAGVDTVVPLSLPQKLDPNSAVMAWLTFAIADGLVAAHDIERYELRLRDVYDRDFEIELGVFRELGDAGSP